MKLIIPAVVPSTPFELRQRPEYLTRRKLPAPPTRADSPALALQGPAPISAPPPEQRNPLACYEPGCKKFGRPFANAFGLQAHQESVHHIKPTPRMTDPKPDNITPAAETPNPPAEEISQKWKCDHCGREDFKNEQALRMHRLHHRDGFTPGIRPQPNNGQFTCGICQKTFRSRPAAHMHHYRSHRGQASQVIAGAAATPRKKEPTPVKYVCTGKSAHGQSAHVGSLDFALNHARQMLTNGFTEIEIVAK